MTFFNPEMGIMLGHKVRDFQPLKEVSLEDLVPEENFYRQVER